MVMNGFFFGKRNSEPMFMVTPFIDNLTNLEVYSQISKTKSYEYTYIMLYFCFYLPFAYGTLFILKGNC